MEKFVAGGSSQNKSNSYISLEEIYDITGIPEGTLVSLYKNEYEKANKEVIKIEKLLKNKDLSKFFEYFNNLSQDDISLIFENGNKLFSSDIKLKDLFQIWMSNFDNVIEFLTNLKIYWDSEKYSESLSKLLDSFNTNSIQHDYIVHDFKDEVLFKKFKNLDSGFVEQLFIRYSNLINSVLSGVVKEDRLAVLNWVDTHYDNKLWVQHVGDKYLLLPFLSKYRWEIFIELLKNKKNNHSLVRYVTNVDLTDMMKDHSLPSYFNLEYLKLNYKEYKDISETGLLKYKNFRDFILFFVKDNYKIKLAKEGDYYIFDKFNNEEYREYYEYLSNLDVIDVFYKINETAKNNSFYKDSIEKELFRIGVGLMKTFFDKITEDKNKIDHYLTEYNYLFKSFPAFLSFQNIFKKIENIKLDEIIYFQYLFFYFIKSELPTKDFYLSFGYKTEDILNTWENVDNIIEKINFYLKDKEINVDLLGKIFDLNEHIKYTIENYTKLYLQVEEIGRDYTEEENGKVVEVKKFEHIFENFTQYINEYDKLKIILNEEEDEYSIFFDHNIEDRIKYWVHQPNEKWRENSNNTISLSFFILEYGKKHGVNPLYLLDSESGIDIDVYLTDENYLKFCGELIEESSLKVEEMESTIGLYALTLFDESNYEKYFRRNIGLYYDKNNKVWYWTTYYNTLSNFYKEDFDFEDTLDHWHFEYDNSIYTEYVEEIDIENLSILAKYFKKVGFNIDTSPLDKYEKEENIRYEKSQEYYREDKELKELLNDVEDIIKEESTWYEEGENDPYDNIDIDSIQNVISYSQGEVNEQAIKNEWWRNQVDQLSEYFNYWPEREQKAFGNNLLKWGKDSKGEDSVFVIPDLWKLIENPQILNLIVDYCDLHSFNIECIIDAYQAENGELNLDNGDPYVSWKNHDYDYFNERLYDRLYEDGIVQEVESKNEGKIYRFHQFK